MDAKIASILKYVAIMSFILVALAHSQEPKVLLQEGFNSLDNWEPFYFRKIDEHSSYTVESSEEGSYLKAESNGSASALIYKSQFNVYEYPYIKWRWKVENLYKKGNARSKKGDDYPIRIYIMFKYDPKKAGFFDKVKYKTAKTLYGQYPPHSGLNYIWANRKHKERILTSKYTDKAKMILMQKGNSNVGKWQDHEANIVKDYKEAFGEEPPAIASIAIMNDSDNTGESSISYVDYIEVFSR